MELLTVRETCRLLKIGQTTLWKLRRQGQLPCVRVGLRAVRFRARDLERYIDRRTKTEKGSRG